MIPSQLQKTDFRFLLVKRKEKAPMEKGWPRYSFDDKRLADHIARGGNYGVCPGYGNICVLDVDDPERLQALGILQHFGDTFAVSNDGSRGHYYFLCDAPPWEKLILKDKDAHLGEVFCKGNFQVVGPGSIHPSGREYKVTRDIPICTFTSQQLQEIFAAFTPVKRSIPADTLLRYRANRNTLSDELGLRVGDFLMPENPVRTGTEIQGAHPVHGSTTGMNLTVNPGENVWHCFRCNSGGDALLAFAVREGIIRCDEARPLDKKTFARVRRQLARKGFTLPKTQTTPDNPDTPTEDERNMALGILKDGTAMETFRLAYALNHDGDQEILRAVSYAACLQSSRTTHGLQLFIGGDKGKGKTNAIRAAINLLPQSCIINSSFSDRSFFVRLMPMVKPIIYLDDTTLTPVQVQTIKRAQTNFQTTTEYTSLAKDFKLVKFTIPPRSVWLGTAVAQDGDSQLKDRFLTLTIATDAKDDERYADWEKKRRIEGRPEIVVDDNVRVSRAIFEHLHSLEFVVRGLENLAFKYNGDRRLINIFLDLLEASAILNCQKREHEEKDGVVYVRPTQADINAALDFSMFAITDDRSEGRLTKAERAMDERIQAHIGNRSEVELSEREIVDLYGKSVNACRTLLYGRDGSQNHITGGLLEKAPWYRIDREKIFDRDGNERRVGQSVIVVSKHEYSVERSGTFAWLETTT